MGLTRKAPDGLEQTASRNPGSSPRLERAPKKPGPRKGHGCLTEFLMWQEDYVAWSGRGTGYQELTQGEVRSENGLHVTGTGMQTCIPWPPPSSGHSLEG